MTRTRLFWIAVMFGIVALGGCSGSPGGDNGHFDGSTPDGGTGGDGATDGEARLPYDVQNVTVDWFPCSLHEGEDDGLAECAHTPMPLFWDDPDGRVLGIRAKRLLASQPADTQLWLLQGGPGASGVISLPAYMETFQQRYPAVDVYTLDHRGTGYSGFLECPEQERPSSPGGGNVIAEEVPACMAELESQWSDGLAAFNTTFSAVDVGAYIHANREPDKRVIVWGGSYGTYWAQRYLTIFPDQADGAVIAGIVAPDTTIITTDEDADRVGRELLTLCGQDTFCASQLGPDPWAFLGEALANREDGTCQNVSLDAATFKLLLFYLMYSHPLNSVVPAAVYRFHRCTPEDGQALTHLINQLFGSSGSWTTLDYSIVLQYHIMLSEMWAHPDFEGVDLTAYFQQVADTVYVGRNLGPMRNQMRELWSLYQDPEYDDRWAETDIPILMLQGRLDPASVYPRAVTVGDHFNGDRQTFVTFDQGPHSLYFGTPLSADPEPEHCAMNLFIAFLADPFSPPELSCVDRVLPIDFMGTTEVSQALLGTDDFWELQSARGPTAEPNKSPSPAILRAIVEVRKKIRQDGLTR